ncbi:MAG: hypothetical protein J7K22_01335, partial [Nanoarchaeota archaeon]|nr:hypothetical protein [Nanoarchaeota archaeon]
HTHNNCEVLFQNLEKWKSNTLFKKRIKLLSDAINFFNKEWKNNDININNIIIPLLINQIEGIRKDFLKGKGYVEIEHNQWQDPVTKQTPSWKKIFKNQFKDSDQFTDWISTIFIDILFGKQTSDSIITWNRHKISHGETSRYGRLENTIRCFMILDFLSELS